MYEKAGHVSKEGCDLLRSQGEAQKRQEREFFEIAAVGYARFGEQGRVFRDDIVPCFPVLVDGHIVFRLVHAFFRDVDVVPGIELVAFRVALRDRIRLYELDLVHIINETVVFPAN